MLPRLALWSATLLFPLPLVLALNWQLDDAFEMRLFISLGLIAYSWWLLGVLLSVRPSWLDRAVGLPSVYALHGTLALLAIVPAYLHSENTFAAVPLAQFLGEWAFYAILVVVSHALLFLSGWLTDRSQLVHRMKAAIEVVFRHQLTIWMHRLTIVIVVMIWVHVHLIHRTNELFTFMTLLDFYTVGVLGTFVWRKWIAPDGNLRGAVGSNVALNGSTRRLTVALDAPAVSARPGDFYFLRFNGSELGSERHPFSATDASQSELVFTIRGTGDFTRRVGGVATATRVDMEGPYGRFDADIADADPDSPLVFIGMGAGVAPLLSLTDGYVRDRRITLLWSVRSADDDYYSDQIAAYEREGNGRFRSVTRVGRFAPAELKTLLTAEQTEAGRYFVVGPNPAVLATRRNLRRLGVSPRRIFDERLTL